MINPIIDPSRNLLTKLGEHFSEKRNKSFAVTEETVKTYEQVRTSDDTRTRQLVILSKRDPHVDPQLALKKYWNARNTDVVVYDTEMHTLPLKKHPAMHLIREFILRDRPD